VFYLLIEIRLESQRRREGDKRSPIPEERIFDEQIEPTFDSLNGSDAKGRQVDDLLQIERETGTDPC
jgi:hypothetical protein